MQFSNYYQDLSNSSGVDAGFQFEFYCERCSECRSETHGARFCPGCGCKMGQQVACTSCSAMLQPGTKFCTECGTRQG